MLHRALCDGWDDTRSTSHNWIAFAAWDERRAAISDFFCQTPLKTPANWHVKPQNHPTPQQSTTSAWHFSYTPTAILDIELKKITTKQDPGQHCVITPLL
jgi:hypothetical protein